MKNGVLCLLIILVINQLTGCCFPWLVFIQILFITFYAYLLLYLHLPPSHIAGSTLITTYHVTFEYEHRALMRQLKSLMQERKRKKRRLLMSRRQEERNGGSEPEGKDGKAGDQDEESSRTLLNPVALLANWFEQRREVGKFWLTKCWWQA